MTIPDTPRLRLRELAEADAPFVVDLLNQPSFLRYIGDRGVRTPGDARAYIRDGPRASYAAHGHGLGAVVLKDTGTPIGLCGLLKRDELPDVDLGFALLPAYEGRGYAREAAEAVLAHGRAALGLHRVLAITSLDNAASIRLLERLGFVFETVIRFEGETLRQFAKNLV